MTALRSFRRVLVPLSLAAAILAGASSALAGVCGPFSDVAGTSPTGAASDCLNFWISLNSDL